MTGPTGVTGNDCRFFTGTVVNFLLNPLLFRYSITLLTWVYSQGTAGEIISYWKSSNYGVGITLENSRPVLHVYSRDQTVKYSLPSSTKLLLDQWNHIAGSYDNSTGVAVLYVDGIPVANKTAIGSLELKTEYDLWLGYLFKGRLSQVFIFNVSLPEKSIKQIMNLLKPSSSK